MNEVLTVAFVIATVSFFKARFKLQDASALAAAFAVSLIVGLAPQLAAQFPALAPWVDALVKVVVLFLGAAGSYDFVQQQRAA